MQVQFSSADVEETAELPQLQLVEFWTVVACLLCARTGAVVVDVLAQFIGGGGRRCVAAATGGLFRALYTGTGPGAVSTGTIRCIVRSYRQILSGTSNKRCVWRWLPQPITATTGPVRTLARRLTSSTSRPHL